MKHWIIALPRTDMEHCIKIGIFGRNRKAELGKIKKGDKIVCYVNKECKIIALGEATSDYYMDDEPLFKANGIFPDRFKFKAKTLGAKKELDIKTLVDVLQFITNKVYWSVFFSSGIKEITKPDWEMLIEKVGHLCAG